MDSKAEKYVATATANIEAQTGLKMREIHRMVDGWGDLKHGQIVTRLKEQLSLGHGHASMIAHAVREERDAGTAAADPLAVIYSGSRAGLRALHEQVIAFLQELGEFELAAKKSYVSLRTGRQFASVGPGSRGRIELIINNRAAVAKGRLEELPAGRMGSHRLFISDAAELDAELLNHVREALEASRC